MIVSRREMVWTPIVRRDSLAVALDHTFAKACMGHLCTDTTFFKETVWRFMGNVPPLTPSNFIDLHTGILPKGFYMGRDGVWLTLESGALALEGRPLIYHGHNEDRYARDRMWLLEAFSAWATAATSLLAWR